MFFRKGSTMVMVVTTIGILTVLGLSISTMAAVNFKYKKVEETRKKTYYSAEAGFDQAYSFVSKEIETAIVNGTAKVQTETLALKEQYRTQFESGVHDSNYDTYMNGDGTYKEAGFQGRFQGWFQEGYTQYLNTEVPDPVTPAITTSLAKALTSKSHSYEIVGALYTLAPVVTVDDNIANPPNTPNDDDVLFNGNVLSIPLISEFSLNVNDINVTRRLATNLEITVPSFEDVSRYNVKSLIVDIQEPSLLFNSLVADGNIRVNSGSNVTINGYAHAYDGIDIKGDLTVKDGLISTNGDIQTSANNSTFTAVNSNVYCSNLQIPKGTSGCKIDVIGSVNTKDDIELNGTKASIDIYGNYYGFSDGSTSSTHDKSSSIVINSSDIGKTGGSYIAITGDNVTGVNYYGREARDDVNEGIYIAGTVYTGNPTDYQTGESVSVKGNYLAYSIPLSGLTDGNDYDDNDNYAKYNSENISFEYENPLVLANKFINPDFPEDNGIRDVALDVSDKADYIKLVYDNANPGLNLGNNKINLDNVEYSLGTFINGFGFESRKNGNVVSFDALKSNKLNFFNYHTNLLSDDCFILNSVLNIDTLDSNRFTVNGLVDFSTTIPTTDYIFSDTAANNVKAAIFNSNSSKPIIIKGNNPNSSLAMINGEDIADAIIISGNSNVQGAIFTNGNVYVTGKVNYSGVIATTKDIIFDNSELKTFTYNAQVAESCIFKAEIENGVKPLDYFKKLTSMDNIKSTLQSDINNGKISVSSRYNAVPKLYNADISVGGVTSYSTVGTYAVFRNMRRVP